MRPALTRSVILPAECHPEGRQAEGSRFKDEMASAQWASQ